MSKYYSQAIIEEIINRIDIVDLVSSHVVLKKRGRSFWGLCPFHSERTASFSVSPDRDIYYCFGCGAGGNAINFIMAAENLTFPEAVEALAARAGIALPEAEYNPQEKLIMEEKQRLRDIHKDAMEAYSKALMDVEIGVPAREYLMKREFNINQINHFSLGYAPDDFEFLVRILKGKYSEEILLKSGLIGKSQKTKRLYDKFRNRLMFPIFDYKGNVIAFGGRVIGAGEPKYLNSPQTMIFDKSNNFYALNVAGANIRKEGVALVTEGYIDVITSHFNGLNNTIATLGTAFTQSHAKLLKRYTNKVVLAYDGDKAGIKAAMRGLDILYQEGFDVIIVLFPDGQDPDDFLKAEGKAGFDNLMRENSYGLLEFKLLDAVKNVDINSISGKGEVVRELAPHIINCRNQVEREAFIASLAKKLGVGQSAIYTDLEKYGFTNKKKPEPQNKPTPVMRGETANIEEKLQLDMVFYIISSKEVYDEVKKTIGFNFTFRQSLQELLTLVQNFEDKEEYNFNPSTLFSLVSDGETKQILLKMLERDVDKAEIPSLATGCIRAIEIRTLQSEVDVLTKALQATQVKSEKEQILKKLVEKQQEIIKKRK